VPGGIKAPGTMLLGLVTGQQSFIPSHGGECIRLSCSYKTDGVEIGGYSQQIPEQHTTLALIFQRVSIQTFAAKPEVLHSMSIWRVRVGSSILVKTKQSAVFIIERHLAFGVGADRKHRNFRNSLSSSPISPGHGSRLAYQELLDVLLARALASQSSISTNF
jgi:hypothetical protein